MPRRVTFRGFDMASDENKLLIRGGLVYDHDGDPHKPAAADILIEGADIVAVQKAVVVGLAGPAEPGDIHPARATTRKFS